MLFTRYLVLLFFLLIQRIRANNKSFITDLGEYLDLEVTDTATVDVEECFTSLYDGDKNNDREISSKEFVGVMQYFGVPGLVSDDAGFSDLPRSIRQAFNLLACICTLDQDSSCCTGDNAHISNQGSGPGETPDSNENFYLLSVCLTVNRAIEQNVETSPSSTPIFLTENPTFYPTVIASTDSPTVISEPSLSPSTIGPSVLSPSTSLPESTFPITTLNPTSITPYPTFFLPGSMLPTIRPPSSFTPTIYQTVTKTPTFFRPGTTEPTLFRPGSMTPTVFRPGTMVPTIFQPGTMIPTKFQSGTMIPTKFQSGTMIPTKFQSGTMIPTKFQSGTMAPTIFRPETINPTTLPTIFIQPTIPPTSFSPLSLAPLTLLPTSGLTSILPSTSNPTTYQSSLPSSPLVSNVLTYVIALRNGETDGVESDLKKSMDALAFNVSAELNIDARIRTEILSQEDIDCPSVVAATDKCQNVTHAIKFSTLNPEDSIDIAELITQVESAIEAGRLQEVLTNSVNSKSNAYIVTGMKESPSSSTDSTGLGRPAILGIFFGVATSLIFLIALLLHVKRKRDEEVVTVPAAAAQIHSSSDSPDIENDKSGHAEFASSSDVFRTPSKASAAALVEIGSDEGAKEEEIAVIASSASSHAGSSGWSSSLGNSTVNSGSFDTQEYIQGSSLAEIRDASTVVEIQEGIDVVVPRIPVTREDLDSAIEVGDWAAVGATAALLAIASDSQSSSSKEKKPFTIVDGSFSSMDAEKIAELDKLVDSGDWEGVMAVATTLASSSSVKSPSKSESQSLSTGASEKRAKVRAEVEELVRQVVPDEVDNVDEMMMQFRGREEELIETLISMQERQVAARARLQGQRKAKLDVRRVSREESASTPLSLSREDSLDSTEITSKEIGGTVDDAASGVAAAVAAAVDVVRSGIQGRVISDDGSSASDSSSEASESMFASSIHVPSILGDQGTASAKGGSPSSTSDAANALSKRQRTALELAIEAGDWEAVGEAAAMLSDTSVQSESTDGVNRFLTSDITTFSGLSSGRSRVSVENVAQLDDMIVRGDWTSVVEAASRLGMMEATATAEDGTRTSFPSYGEDQTQEEKDRSDQARRSGESRKAKDEAQTWAKIAAEDSSVEDSESRNTAAKVISATLSSLKKPNTDEAEK